MSVVRFDEAQLEAVERERAEEEALGPLERFEKLYRTFEDEDEAAAFVQTLAAMFEVKRRSCSTDDYEQPFLMRWCTLSPNDCKLMVYRDATEGDLSETIFLRGASVVQIADGLPPDVAARFENRYLVVVGAARYHAAIGARRRTARRASRCGLLARFCLRAAGGRSRQHS